MKRFTYVTPAWAALAVETDLGPMRLERLALAAGLGADQVSAWRQDLMTLPVWFVLLAHLHADAPQMPDAVDLGEFLNGRAVMRSQTLARLLGVNPQTVRRWAKGARDVPAYLPLLLGLLCSVRGVILARRVAANLIVSDAEWPGVAYPFRVAA